MIFLESPWPILFIGIVVEAILLIVLFRTGRGAMLWPIVGVALVVLLGVIIERSVVTERKSILKTLDEAAAACQANDLGRLGTTISPAADAATTRADAQRIFTEIDFARVSVRSPEITVIHTTSPPTAAASVSVLVTAKARNGDFLGEQTRPVPLSIHLRLESDRWLIIDYKILDDPRTH